MSFRIRALEGDAALRLVEDRTFVAEWRALALADPGLTWFQEPTFCRAWYGAYAARHAPLLIGAWQDDALVGLMPLARVGDGLAHAGAHQCEYQGWVADPSVDAEFGRRAVATAIELCPGRWQWNNAAPDTPADWLQEPGAPGFLVESFDSPVLDVHDTEFLDARMKGRLRSYRNKLERRGLRYQRFTDTRSAREFLPQLELWCDLRQAAAHASVPFAQDPAKTEFHARLLDDTNEVWLSVLWLDDLAIAAHLGPFAGGELAMGVQGYDAREGRLSPATILMFEMAADVAACGGNAIDLTPGGDAWKERYASGHRAVHRVVLHRSRTAAIAESARNRAAAGARAAVRQVAGDPARLRDRLSASTAATVRQYEVDAGALPSPGPGPEVTDSFDRIQRLLVDHAVARGPEAAREMLSTALRRMALGWSPVAEVRRGRLEALLWVPPADARVDLSDPADPRLKRDGNSGGDGLPEGTLVLLADAAGGLPPSTEPATTVAAAATFAPFEFDRLLIVTDASEGALHEWLVGGGTRHRAAAG